MSEDQELAVDAAFNKLMQLPIVREMIEDQHYETVVSRFQEAFSKYSSRGGDGIGDIIAFHLTVEIYLDKYLVVANPHIDKILDAKLSFFQKIHLAYSQASAVSLYFDPLLQFNSIRNKIAHNPDTQISTLKIDKIKKIVDSWESAAGRPVPELPIAVLRTFAANVCVQLDSITQEIARRTPETGASGYQQRVRDELKKLESETSQD